MKTFIYIRSFSIFYVLLWCFVLQAQDSTATLIFSGYAEIYYAYDFSRPADHVRPAFLYNHHRHNEVTVNVAFLKAAYQHARVRANLALMTGTYANANLAAEPGVFKNILEANAGLRLSARTWLDVGVFSSHIGFESAISKDCWTLTRSIVAENSPYYESGAKLTFAPNARWSLAVLALNGWQRMARVTANNTPAAGTQVSFTPHPRLVLNYSTFIGSDKPDSLRQLRFYQNVYGIWQLTQRFGMIAGFDYGIEQPPYNREALTTWYTPTLIGRYQFDDHWTLAARWERFVDKKGVLIASNFATTGYSATLSYAPVNNALLRVEARKLVNDTPFFTTHTGLRRSNTALLASLAISF